MTHPKNLSNEKGWLPNTSMHCPNCVAPNFALVDFHQPLPWLRCEDCGAVWVPEPMPAITLDEMQMTEAPRKPKR